MVYTFVNKSQEVVYTFVNKLQRDGAHRCSTSQFKVMKMMYIFLKKNHTIDQNKLTPKP